MLVRALLGHVKKSLVVTSLVRVEPYLSGAQKKKLSITLENGATA